MSIHPDAYTQFKVVDNYLTAEECDQLVALYDASPFRDPDLIGFWAQRVKWPVYPDDIRVKIRKQRRELAESLFNKKFETRNLNITLWRVGDFQGPHSDYGGRNEYPDRDYASIIYLNDDFEGGEIYMPEWKMSHVPKKGQLVIFPGGTVLHGVTEVKKNRRLTSICWFKSA